MIPPNCQKKISPRTPRVPCTHPPGRQTGPQNHVVDWLLLSLCAMLWLSLKIMLLIDYYFPCVLEYIYGWDWCAFFSKYLCTDWLCSTSPLQELKSALVNTDHLLPPLHSFVVFSFTNKRLCFSWYCAYMIYMHHQCLSSTSSDVSLLHPRSGHHLMTSTTW